LESPATPGRLITIEQRKLNIHQDEVRPFGHRGPYTLLAIFGFNYFETRARQKIAQDLQVVLLIFDHQNALCHAGLACPWTVMGSVNANVEP
jgi:hypothetical protein